MQSEVVTTVKEETPVAGEAFWSFIPSQEMQSVEKHGIKELTGPVLINRADHDIRRLKTYRVCSDLFSDTDYQKEDWEHYEKTGAGNITSSRMRLNDTCIPNTDPNTGKICLYISGQPAEKRPRRSLKKSVESEPYKDSSDKVSLVTSTDMMLHLLMEI